MGRVWGYVVILSSLVGECSGLVMRRVWSHMGESGQGEVKRMKPEKSARRGRGDKRLDAPDAPDAKKEKEPAAVEHGGPSGAEPTRFGDWERGGRCSDF